MTAFQETALIAGREISRNLKSAKGIALIVLCLLGGILAAMLIAWVHKMDIANMKDVPPDVAQKMQEEALKRILTLKYGGDEKMGEYLSKAPFVLLSATFAGVWLSPLLVALVGFDSIPNDLQHRGVRYFTVRVQRHSYYIGKALGIWVVVSVMLLFCQIMIWGVAVARGGATVSEVLSWGPRFWLVTVAVAGAWSGIAQLVSSQFKMPILALLITCASFFVLWIVGGIGELWKAGHALVYAYPNSYDAFLLSPHADKIAIGAIACIGFLVATTGAGSYAFSRRDV